MWERAMALYNKDYRPIYAPIRDTESIRNKYKSLKNATKPTGDPTCPPEVRRAKQIASCIESGIGVFGLDDNVKEISASSASSSSNSSKSSDSESDSEEDQSSPILVRQGLAENAPVIDETHVPFVVPESLVLNDAQRIDVHDSDIEVEVVQIQISDHVPQKSAQEPSQRAGGIVTQASMGLEFQSSKIPLRLGKNAVELKASMDGILKNSAHSKQGKRGIPENPTHTKKKAVSQHIADIDKEYETRAEMEHRERLEALQDAERRRDEERKAKEMRHELEMKKLDLEHARQEKRYEEESKRRDEDSRRHETFMLALITAVTAGRPMQPPPAP
jgi:hypothetical protein